MLTDLYRERQIRRTLKRLSRQRVVERLEPGSVWLIERAVSENEPGVAAHLRTCHLRGWVEVVEYAPHGAVTAGFDIEYPQDVAPVYRLTEAGWAALKRTHEWVIRTFIVAAAAVAVAILSWTLP